MVKGSLGSRMGPIVKALKRRYARASRTAFKVEPMLYWLADFSSTISVFNVFRYLTVRTGGAMMTALLFVFLFGPWIIDHLRLRQGKGQPIREDGPQSHLADQARHADDGRADDPLGRHGVDPAVGESVESLCLDRARRDAGFGLVGFYDDYLKVTKQTHGGFAGRLRLVIEAAGRGRRLLGADRASGGRRSRPR